jgi:anti-anti-sigma factor
LYATEPRTPALTPHVKGEEMLGTCKALGAIDATNAPSFRADLHDAIDNSDEAFVHVDCSAVTYIDSAGYHVLVNATNYAVRRGHTLVIRNLSPSCATVIRTFDVDRELHVES